jgi:hypothetical protein
MKFVSFIIVLSSLGFEIQGQELHGRQGLASIRDFKAKKPNKKAMKGVPKPNRKPLKPTVGPSFEPFVSPTITPVNDPTLKPVVIPTSCFSSLKCGSVPIVEIWPTPAPSEVETANPTLNPAV